MSKGLGKTQRAIIKLVARYEYYGMSVASVNNWLRFDGYSKPSISRAIKALVVGGYVLRSDKNILRATSKGLLVWSQVVTNEAKI